MFINHPVKKMIAVALAAAALAVAIEIAAQPAGAKSGTGRLCTTTYERGYPNAVPPILPPPPCSVLRAIRREEAIEGREFWYDPPANARYSNAEMNAYASESK